MVMPHKFQNDDVALWYDQWVAIIDYRQDSAGNGFYRVLSITHMPAGQCYGQPRWVAAFRLDKPAERYKYRRARTVVNANERLGTSQERGCSCNCCPHLAMTSREIRPDGTLAWEAAPI